MSYAWFFWMAFVGALLWLLASGWRERLPPWRWAIMLLAAVSLGLVGSKLAAISLQTWRQALWTHTIPVVWSKSWLGGLALAGLAVLFLGKRLGLPKHALDLLVAPAFLAMAVGRVGCLEGGCCLGTPTSLPWALHRVGGVGVHPVPIYEMIFAVGLVVAVWRLHLRPGGRFSLAVFLYLGFRFLEGFLRPGRVVVAGLKAQQLTVLVLLGLWLWYTSTDAEGRDRRWPRGWNPAAVLATLALFSLAFGVTLASPLERLVLWTAFILVLGGTAVRETVDRGLAARGRKGWVLGVGLVALVLTLAARFPSTPDSLREVEKFWAVGLGGTMGRYQETCGGTHDVQMGAVKIERVIQEPGGLEGRAGIQLYAGTDETTYERLPIFVVNPYLALDSRWVGVSGSVYVGKVVVDGERRKSVPSFGLRLGPRNLLFAHAGVGGTFPGGVPIPGVRLGLGFGLGKLGQFRFGFGFTGWYVEPHFRLPSGVTVLARGGGAEGTYEFGVGVTVPVAREKR